MQKYSNSYRETEETSLVPMLERELAAWLIDRGRSVIAHEGRHWLETWPGFFSAVHPMARMSAREATRPTWACWGFRTTLQDADREIANGSLPLHLLRDIDSYTLQTRSPRIRNKIRNLRRQVRIVELHRPDLLLAQGYDILRSTHLRTGYGKVPSLDRYQKAVERYYASGHGLVIGGLLDGKLGGYLTSHAIGPTAYLDELFLDSRYLHSNISLGLFFEWVQICRRSATIREVVHGQHAREAPGLCRHKTGLGLSVVHVPARFWFAPLTGNVVRRLRPHAYYRLTGHE